MKVLSASTLASYFFFCCLAIKYSVFYRVLLIHATCGDNIYVCGADQQQAIAALEMCLSFVQWKPDMMLTMKNA